MTSAALQEKMTQPPDHWQDQLIYLGIGLTKSAI
jgi:hypothetical protein